MRIAISIIVILLISALAWFALGPSPTDRIEATKSMNIPESTQSKTDSDDQKVVVPPQPKSIVESTPTETVVDTVNSTVAIAIAVDDQEPQAVQELSMNTESGSNASRNEGVSIDEEIINFLTNQIERENLLGLVIQKQFVERFTTFIDNLPRKNLPRKFIPIKPPGGLFLASQDTNGEFIARENHERYYNYVRLLEKIDIESAIDLYIDLYPYFQKAYAQLGYPDHSFHNRLTYVIDHLLETPKRYDPVYIKRPKVLYIFADPSLESLSAGQKLLLRTGAQNVRNIQRILKRVKRQMRSPEI